MMQQPLIWLAVLLVALLLGCLVWWQSRSRHLRLRIEPVPTQRLDPTPVERTEILGPARVRHRGQPAPADDAAEAAAPRPPEQPEPADADVADDAEQPVADLAEPAADAVAADAEATVTEVVAEPLPAVPKLTQEDMFPDATVPVRLPESGKSPLFQAVDCDPVDPTQASQGDGQPLPDIERVLSLHVMARGDAFDGRKLLELLLKYGLRFGDMDIFHRHEFPTGQGMVFFSVAQAMEPGTFNLDRMERDTVPGVSLFLSLPGYKSLNAYDLMVDTARRLAQELEGDLLDQHSQAVTPGQLDVWREQVIDFERKRLMSQ